MNKIIITIGLIISLFTPAVAELIRDDFIEEQLANKILEKPTAQTKFNYASTAKVKVPLQITKVISSSGKDAAFEGQIVEFIVKDNVIYNDKIYIPKDTKITGRVSAVIKKGISGIPGELYISDLQIPNVENSQILEPIVKRGLNTTLWILPLKWALTPLPPFGTFTNIIWGWDAKLKPSRTIYVSVYPEWNL